MKTNQATPTAQRETHLYPNISTLKKRFINDEKIQQTITLKTILFLSKILKIHMKLDLESLNEIEIK